MCYMLSYWLQQYFQVVFFSYGCNKYCHRTKLTLLGHLLTTVLAGQQIFCHQCLDRRQNWHSYEFYILHHQEMDNIQKFWNNQDCIRDISESQKVSSKWLVTSHKNQNPFTCCNEFLFFKEIWVIYNIICIFSSFIDLINVPISFWFFWYSTIFSILNNCKRIKLRCSGLLITIKVAKTQWEIRFIISKLLNLPLVAR